MPAASEKRVSLLRQTPFRLALTFAALLITAFLLTGFAIYQEMRSTLTKDLDESVRTTFAVVADTYQDRDIEDLVATVESHSRQVTPDDRAYSLVGPDGKLLAGTALQATVNDDLQTISMSLAGHERERFRAYSGDVGGNRLTVAFSMSEIDELLEVVLGVFGWTSFAVLALAIGGGIWLANRAQRRLDAIATTMNAVSHGQMDRRIPLIGSGDDIDQLSARVNTALDRLNNMMDGVRQVSNDIAHELKTPLNRLQLMVERAVEKPEPDNAALHDALEEIAGLNATFEAMLRIARIESGAGKSRFADFDLAALLAGLVDIYTEVATDENRELTFAGPSSGGTVFGDRDLLTQLFANLIENALRHTQASASIAASISNDNGLVIASVADNGPGIPPDERANVLRRLYRLDKSRSNPGTGLGLSIVAAIADLHEAELILDDNAPGLRVTVRFSANR